VLHTADHLFQIIQIKSFIQGASLLVLQWVFLLVLYNGVGMALGIIPVTNVNYKVNQHGTDPNTSIGDYDISYEGSGGLSKVFVDLPTNFPF